ncbi:MULTISPECIES: sulfite exporter TauE/SafE family protein [unclassified Caballeronia]|uniref:sulfite exporter TauE/SafE family protein n=1 Tax=unclassified Caballeronia TaxID=2646786 RepID=UPI002867AD52|nr:MULTISPECIES: sulfite exporter TauE/SafE family protein [unclassified Caballeronia]MDR5820250.1 sulfite exporter TauE/SafE family protein [Caballeronia sp. LZ043]MDR5878067.1 sulfite exporter TauE/SafE family protein [Caballeronia sp. LZ032]
MTLSVEIIAMVLVAGLLCGFLNTVASSGSAVSLPILMSIGLHAATANATNRIPVLVGALAATVGIARKGVIPWRRALKVAAPLALGAAVGALASEHLPGHDLRKVIVGAVIVALILIFTRLKRLLNAAGDSEFRFDARTVALLFVVGIWTGFIVLDSGTYMLLVLVLAAGLTLVEANIVKNFATLFTTTAAMLVFMQHGNIDWRVGGIMGLGSLAGGLIGARIAVSEHARRWIVGLLVTVIIGELLHLAIPAHWLSDELIPAINLYASILTGRAGS